MIPAQKIVKALSGATALLAVSAMMGSSQPAFAQGPSPAAHPLMRSSGPVLAATGETVLLCAANNQLASLLPPTPPAPAALTSAAAVTPLNVTLQILNGVTGAVLAQAQLALSPLGSTETPPDPCVNFSVAPSTVALPASLFVARVLLNPQPLPPGICAAHALAVSLQVFTPDGSGNPTNIRTISFLPPDPCHG
jgi:hypothetical protein